MPKTDREYMEDAVVLADKCKPIKDSIPRVGAIIVAADGTLIAEGWRGNGGADDDHAEHRAIHSALEKHPAKIAGATLYTTLEPCTPEVRTKGEECCIKLIEQFKINKVFVGIVDPNEGVTGKGLRRLISQNGKYWPQLGTLRQLDQWVWEINAHFGGIGSHDVHLVTANDLGQVLMGYYRKVIRENEQRWERLRGKVQRGDMGGLYPPIEMNGLPKGLRLEASVTMVMGRKLVLNDVTVEPTTIIRGGTLNLTYDIESFEDIPTGIWLGSSFNDSGTQKLIFNTSQDKEIPVLKGRRVYERELTIPTGVSLGSQMLRAEGWYGVVGNTTESKLVTTRPPTEIKIVE